MSNKTKKAFLLFGMAGLMAAVGGVLCDHSSYTLGLIIGNLMGCVIHLSE